MKGYWMDDEFVVTESTPEEAKELMSSVTEFPHLPETSDMKRMSDSWNKGPSTMTHTNPEDWFTRNRADLERQARLYAEAGHVVYEQRRPKLIQVDYTEAELEIEASFGVKLLPLYRAAIRSVEDWTLYGNRWELMLTLERALVHAGFTVHPWSDRVLTQDRVHPNTNPPITYRGWYL